jgi:membrane-bound lytic murein transglycosylase B
MMLGVVVALVCARPAVASDPDRGWSYLIERLAHDGVPRDRVLQVFRDERVDEFDGLQFSLNPRESPALYRHLRTRATATRARRCLAEYEEVFTAAERQFGVSSDVVASIIQVESGCGANTGRSRILPALARLAMAAEPSNLERNIDRLTLLNGSLTPGSIESSARWRAQKLDDMFYPEVKATFDIAERMRTDPLDIRGSGSGAFGIPQFLPRSYLRYGVDGDGDGRVSLYDPADAIASCAHYLQDYGWRPGLSRSAQRNVIWGYNHSDAYIDTVLWVASEVESPTPEPAHTTPKKKSSPKKRSTTTRKKSVATHSTHHHAK